MSAWLYLPIQAIPENPVINGVHRGRGQSFYPSPTVIDFSGIARASVSPMVIA